MKSNTNECTTCGSSEPHKHPAIQCGGEVEICANDFHLQETPQNNREYISAVKEKQADIREPT